MNILILTGKFGMGHWSASQSLRQQLLHSFPDARVEVEDFLTYAMPNLAETMYKGFNMVVTYGSHLFNVYYKLTAMGHPDARPPFEGLLLDKLTELLWQYQPDAVIATHPLCAQLVSRLKEQAGEKGAYGLDLPLITCVTDVSSHPEWINQNTDCYMVASREVRQELVEKGVNPSLICVTGIPVREEFRHLGRCSIQNGKAARENEGSSREDIEAENVQAGENSAEGDIIGPQNAKMREYSAIECYKTGGMGENEEKSNDSLSRNGLENGKIAEHPFSNHYKMKDAGVNGSLLWEQYDRNGEAVNKYLFSGNSGTISMEEKFRSFFHSIGADVQKQMTYEQGQISSLQGKTLYGSRGNGKGKKREVLIMGGGLGLLPRSEAFYDALNELPDTHITIITGRNRKLLKRLEAQQRPGGTKHRDGQKRPGGRWENIQLVGYTDQVWEYMSRADLIVTKPGGITLFETIFAQVPILTWPPTLQQEKGNACWLMEEGIGWVAKKKNCAKEIYDILTDEERLSRARYRMGQLKEQMKAESLNGLMEVIAMSQSAAV